jgi:hypothetical protein
MTSVSTCSLLTNILMALWSAVRCAVTVQQQPSSNPGSRSESNANPSVVPPLQWVYIRSKSAHRWLYCRIADHAVHVETQAQVAP